MAKFSFNGMDEISASFEQLSNITDEDKMSVLNLTADAVGAVVNGVESHAVNVHDITSRWL